MCVLQPTSKHTIRFLENILLLLFVLELIEFLLVTSANILLRRTTDMTYWALRLTNRNNNLHGSDNAMASLQLYDDTSGFIVLGVRSNYFYLLLKNFPRKYTKYFDVTYFFACAYLANYKRNETQWRDLYVVLVMLWLCFCEQVSER